MWKLLHFQVGTLVRVYRYICVYVLKGRESEREKAFSCAGAVETPHMMRRILYVWVYIYIYICIYIHTHDPHKTLGIHDAHKTLRVPEFTTLRMSYMYTYIYIYKHIYVCVCVSSTHVEQGGQRDATHFIYIHVCMCVVCTCTTRSTSKEESWYTHPS